MNQETSDMPPTTTTGTARVTLPADDQILITREFAAPRHLVWKAWTTPDLVMKWWSGHRATMRSVAIDLRPGGRWRYVMGKAGEPELAFHGQFHEIVEGEMLVHTEVFEMPGSDIGPDDDDTAILDRVRFIEVGGGTRLEMLVECGTQEIRDTVIDSGMEGGMQEQMDLLDELALTLDEG
jgi:uncharacterized protein YndB with AHSA1/START domain